MNIHQRERAHTHTHTHTKIKNPTKSQSKLRKNNLHIRADMPAWSVSKNSLGSNEKI